MANERDVRLLLEGVEVWNEHRGDRSNPPDLSGLDFLKLFEKAGKLGKHREIPLAGYNFQRSNLVGARLYGANLSNADLFAADLTDAYLARANLVDAWLWGAKLNGADLTNADLSNASLPHADLIGTNLTCANLPHANLVRADLLGAKLLGAKLPHADLFAADLTYSKLTNANLANAIFHDTILDNALCITANFTDSDLTGAKLRKSVIFDGVVESPIQHRIKLQSIKSTRDLLERIKGIKSRYQDPDEALRFYFRGESQCKHQLRPSVMRKQSLVANESNMLTALASRRPEEFNGLVSGLAQLVTAQHHGLKTRFLDISSNPLVALFHACGERESSKERSKRDGRLHVFVAPRQMVKPFNSDTVSVIANYARLPIGHQRALTGRPATSSYTIAMEQLVQLILSEKPYFESRVDPRDFYRVIIVEPQQSWERIRAQSGAFLVSAFHERFEREEILQRNTGVPVYAHYPLTVSREAKPEILKQLQMLNITRETLFPGLETAAKAIMESYRRRHQ